MTNISQAVEAAKNYLRDAYADRGIGDLLLEEVVFDEVEGRRHWKITVSYRLDNQPDSTQITHSGTPYAGWAAILNPAKPGRHYKVLEIDDETKQVIAMRIRNFAAA